jgi:hypothetical protein
MRRVLALLPFNSVLMGLLIEIGDRLVKHLWRVGVVNSDGIHVDDEF